MRVIYQVETDSSTEHCSQKFLWLSEEIFAELNLLTFINFFFIGPHIEK